MFTSLYVSEKKANAAPASKNDRMNKMIIINISTVVGEGVIANRVKEKKLKTEW